MSVVMKDEKMEISMDEQMAGLMVDSSVVCLGKQLVEH